MDTSSEISGATASNAGDDFHELWALREALRVLDPQSGVSGITLEGVATKKSSRETGRRWDGVDCGMYFGGKSIESAQSVDLVQLKYSVGQSTKNWTLSRLASSTASKGNNSVARRLGDAFKGISKLRTKADVEKSVTITLVTNQPIGPRILSLIDRINGGEAETDDAKKLRSATGLSKAHFHSFCKCLRLIGDHAARSRIQVDVIRELYFAADTDVRSKLDDLQMNVREEMLPEAKKAFIDKDVVLSWFGVGDPRGLFPCEPRFEVPESIIERNISQDLAELVLSNSKVCFHGGGGCGKSTTILDLESRLPSGSIVIPYDCYGAGNYTDPSQSRHLPEEAFSQLSNEMSRRLRLPTFFVMSNSKRIAASFRSRLKLASTVVEKRSKGALLVVVVDAADNAVTVADKRSPRDECFARDLAMFQDLPKNFRLVFSSRTGRLESLSLPQETKFLPCPFFDEPETEKFLGSKNLKVTDNGIHQFHVLSRGVPRVQATALEGKTSLEEALEFLRPNGKSLDDIFAAQFAEAKRKAGGEEIVERIKNVLAVLPTPMPVDIIAEVARVSHEDVSEFCDDLLPSIRLTGYGVEFANEDFEEFVLRVDPDIADETAKIAAEVLFCRRHESEYAAIHLFDCFALAGRGGDQFSLLSADEGSPISDPVIRKKVSLQRLQSAVRYAANKNDVIQAVKSTLIGAAALEDDFKVSNYLRTHIQLAVSFAEVTIRHEVLRNPEERDNHGPILMLLAEQTSLSEETLSLSYEWRRYANIWLKDREASSEDHTSGWNIPDESIAAWAYSIYRDRGWESAFGFIESWRPDSLPPSIMMMVLRKIRQQDGLDELHRIRKLLNLKWRLFSSCVAIRSGEDLDALELQREAAGFASSYQSDLGIDQNYGFEKERGADVLDEILFFVQACIQKGVAKDVLLKVLDAVWDYPKLEATRSSVLSSSRFDFSLQVEALRSVLTGEKFDKIEIFLPKKKKKEEQSNKSLDEDEKFFAEVAGPLIKFYSFLRDALSQDDPASAKSLISKATEELNRNSWQNERRYEFDRLREAATRNIVNLAVVFGVDASTTICWLKAVVGKGRYYGGALDDHFASMLLSTKAHEEVSKQIEGIAQQAEEYEVAATESADVFARLAELYLPISVEDARVYFNRGVDAIQEMDYEAIDEVHFLACAFDALPHENGNSRILSAKFAVVGERMHRVLDGNDNFPTSAVLQAIAGRSLSMALCVLGRWSDVGLVSVDHELSLLLASELSSKSIDVEVASALAFIAEASGVRLNSELLQHAGSLDGEVGTRLAEELAGRVSLLSSSDSILAKGNEIVDLCGDAADNADNVKRLEGIVRFIEENKADVLNEDMGSHKKTSRRGSGQRKEEEQAFEYSSIEIENAESILQFVEQRRTERNLNDEEMFDALRTGCSIGQRTAHLDALLVLACEEEWSRLYVRAIQNALEVWATPSVKAWEQTAIPQLISAIPDILCGYGWYDDDLLETLLCRPSMSDLNKSEVLLSAIEFRGGGVGSRTLYRLASKIVQQIDVHEAEQVIDWYLDKKMDRGDVQAGGGLSSPLIDVNKVPAKFNDTVWQFLYRCLGDIDARIRWQAAHAMTCMVRNSTLEDDFSLSSLWKIQNEFEFSAPGIPFHWMTARLWLLISIARISSEKPDFVARHAKELIALYEEGPPHILMITVLKNALDVAGSSQKLSGEVVRKAGLLTGSEVDRRKPDREGGREHLGHGTNLDDIRFRFDSTDTIPYWYDPAQGLFFDVTPQEFLKIADKWVVDEWGAAEETTRWDEEPRRERFENRSFGLYSHGHGAYPIFERYSHYLQWHAMFVTVGELLRTRVISSRDDEEQDALSYWLNGWMPIYPAHWPSDLRSPAPLELKYWSHIPEREDTWIDSVDANDLLNELSYMKDGCRWIVLSANRSKEKVFDGAVRVEESVSAKAATVSPATASALARALQITEDPWDYGLPGHEDDDTLRIDKAGFHLDNIINHYFSREDVTLEEGDEQRNGVSTIRAAPCKAFLQQFGLEIELGAPVLWKEQTTDRPIAEYRQWSDTQVDYENRNQVQYRKHTGDGYRLSVSFDSLLTYLKIIERDLFVKVEITRLRKGNHGRRNKEETTERDFGKLFIIRQDGTVEDFRGHLCSWKEDRG